jgi:photosystem II stability/assembly factor-like uncharacterized protein
LIEEVLVASDETDTLYVVTANHQVLRSTDGGVTAIDITPTSEPDHYWNLTSHPLNPNRLWVLSGGHGVWRSDDGGLSWAPANDGLEVDGTGDIPVDHLAIDPLNADGAWLIQHKRIYRTDDAAAWREVGQPMATGPLLAAPGEPRVLLLGFSGILRSTDGGVTWKAAGLVGEEVYEMVWLAERGWIVALGSRGVHYSTDLGRSWKRTGQGIGAADVHGVHTIGPDGATVIAALADCGPNLARSKDGGRTWELRPIDGVPATWAGVRFEFSSVAAAPSRPSRVYATSGDAVARSEDSGLTWDFHRYSDGISGASGGHLAVSPHDPDIVFTATSRGLSRSRDGAVSWETLLGEHPFDDLVDVAISPQDPLLMLASGDGIVRSIDGGESWMPVPDTTFFFVGDLAFDPHNPGIVLAARRYYEDSALLRSSDGGVTWQPSGTGLEGDVSEISFHPAQPGVVIAGTDSGLYRSIDGGASWQHDDTLAAAFPPSVHAVHFAPDGRLYAGSADGVHVNGDPPFPTRCERNDGVACLLGGRFETRGVMWDFEYPRGDYPLAVMHLPRPRAESDQSIFFESFQPGNLEIAVKMVDACRLQPGHPLRAAWLFLGGLTNADAEILIEDLGTRSTFSWHNPPGEFPTTLVDTRTFGCPDAVPAACDPGPEVGCLLAGRFRVTGTMRDFGVPPEEFPARVMSFAPGRTESRQAVFFESFDAGNFEVGVKMVNGCGLPDGHPHRAYWAFYGGLTNAATQIVITDVATGRRDAWSNAAGELPLSEGRTAAFPCDP